MGSRALKHYMINQLMQLKIPPPLKKISDQNSGPWPNRVWALDLLEQMVQFFSFQPSQLSDSHFTQNPSPQIVLSLPVCRNRNRKWKITMSSLTVQ